MTFNLHDAFEEKLDKDGDKHIWTGSTNNIGYPKMKVDGHMELASHVALREAGRKVPDDAVVMHHDNNPKNLNPSNLSVGTQKQNLKHMRDEGRDRPRGVHQEPDVKKEAAGPSSFMDQRMKSIAQSAFTRKKIAAFFDEIGAIAGKLQR